MRCGINQLLNMVALSPLSSSFTRNELKSMEAIGELEISPVSGIVTTHIREWKQKNKNIR